MSSSDYIGRIGGLAAALGIGAAVLMAPGVAWAGPDSSAAGASSDANPAATSDNSAAQAPAPSRGVRQSARAEAGTRVRPGSESAPGAGVSGAVDAVVERVTAARNGRAAKNSDVPSAAAATPAAAATSADSAPVAGRKAAAVTNTLVLPSVTAPRVTVAPTVAAPAQSLPEIVSKLTSLLQSRPAVQPAPHFGPVLTSVADRLTAAVNSAISRITDAMANGSPFGPGVDSPINWLLLAVTRKQLLPAATSNVVVRNPATPVLVLNGYDVVPTSKLDAVSFYGPYTTWPGYSGLQGTQEFDLVDPDTGNTVGSFTAHVRKDTYTSTEVLQVVEVRSGTVGTEPGQTPPVGSIISISGQGKKFSSVYSDMPTQSGYVNGYNWITPFGTVPLKTKYNAAAMNTDYVSVNKPLDMLNGYNIAPIVPSTMDMQTIAGMPPTFTAVQGTQSYAVRDAQGNEVGYFDGLVTTTSDFFGLDTKMIVVTDTFDQTNVGLGAGDVPPEGTVYNVLYFTDTRYVLYQSSPTPEGQYVATTLVLPRRNIPVTIGNLDASYPPPLDNFELPGGSAFRPTVTGPLIGGNGLPPREMEAQSSAKYDVLDANGNKVGSFDSYLTRQWDWVGIWQDEIMVINVTEGTPGVNGVPPVGTVYTSRMVGSTGFGELYTSTPTPGGGAVSKHYWVTPFGYIKLGTPKDSAVNANLVNFNNPFVP